MSYYTVLGVIKCHIGGTSVYPLVYGNVKELTGYWAINRGTLMSCMTCLIYSFTLFSE